MGLGYDHSIKYEVSNMRKSLFFLSLFILACPHGANAEIKIDPKSGFVPHKALYDISLEEIRNGAQIVNVSGQMYYEWAPDCDGWNTNHRFNLLYEYADSQPLKVASDFSTFESYDGKTINFSSQRKNNGTLFEEVRGIAEIDENGVGEAKYSIPKDLSYDLPKGALFPMFHSIEIAKSMKEGKRFFNTVIFDGSDEDGPVEVNAFIGKALNEIQPVSDKAGLDQELLNSPAKEVVLAFFPLKDNAPTADYEMTLNFHENSVISDMHIEYGTFTVRQKLIALEPVENACTKEE